MKKQTDTNTLDNLTTSGFTKAAVKKTISALLKVPRLKESFDGVLQANPALKEKLSPALAEIPELNQPV